ncbi:recombinase [Chlorobium phaeovibrioides]|uniref:Recombinase n=1 Tax=Chlorobium phaeovibrioides TaxID=1094 RepID=A0A5M8I8V2_CHLPH|nr:recombinase RecT [Chlorobium phaeovibrioides]KAA6230669.1 recombinase [Chlorobium phaeovibrioides]
MSEAIQTPQQNAVQRFRTVLEDPIVQEQFKNALEENAPLFVASLIDVVSNDKVLQECSPKDLIREAFKAATLKLPINKGLGFAWIVPFREKGVPKPQMQIGYKGYIQLAQRTAQYRYINADIVYEGELKKADKLTGEINLNGEATGDKVIGYFAHIETTNGFRKTLYMTKAQIESHAKRYSKSFSQGFSPWKTNFDEMAMKTVINSLLKRYGILSVEMLGAFQGDDDQRTPEAKAQDDITNFANSESAGFSDAEIIEPAKKIEGTANGKVKAPF